MENIRLIEIPRSKMISSGFGTLEELMKSGFDTRFPNWERTVFPHDFMSYDPERKQMVWYYLLADDTIDPGDFEVIDFEGGLYAACVSIDGNDTDGARVYEGIKAWVAASEHLELDERPGHYTMFHVSTSPNAMKALGYNQLDLFVPVKAETAGK